MATMFPSGLPPAILKEPRRQAEVDVFDAFRDQLDDAYHVFYSSPWLGTKPDGSEVDGEADFVVAHPELGILTIEVKGGGISIDADNEWTSTDRHGITRRIKNPVDQARQSKHELLHKLKASKSWRPRYINMRHGVILRHVKQPAESLRPDMPLDLFAFAADMDSLGSWVARRFGSTKIAESPVAYQPLGSDGLVALDDLLARPIRLNVQVGTSVEEDLKEIKLKSAEQVWILEDLKANRRMAIAGAAGTGKTILAVEKAVMMAKEGRRTLLVCYNRPLSQHLQTMVKAEPLVTATHFDKFCRDVANAAGLDTSHLGHEYLAHTLIDNFATADLEEFDAIIIDEGQDFKDEWLQSLEVIVRDERDGILYVFYDDNQSVSQSLPQYICQLPAAQYRLGRNFRNTQKIFEQASRHYRGSFVRCIGPTGEPVQFTELAAGVSLADVIRRRVGRLVKSEGIQAEDIALLLPSMQLVESIRTESHDRFGSIPIINAEEKGNAVTVDSVRRFKGLESPVVLLVLTAELRDYDELLYTAITRAQARLEVFAPRNVIERMQAA